MSPPAAAGRVPVVASISAQVILCVDVQSSARLVPLADDTFATAGTRVGLNEAERQVLKDVLCCELFADCDPPTIYATLLDEGNCTWVADEVRL